MAIRLKPKDRVISQIKHQETELVPYRLAFETEALMDNLDAFFGDRSWRTELDNHILYLDQPHPGLAIPPTNPTYGHLWKDCFGGQWNITKHPSHIEIPPISIPDLSGFSFPEVKNCISPNWVEESCKTIKNNPDYFIVARLGFGLFERSWALRGFENALLDSSTEQAFYSDLINGIANFQSELLIFILEHIPVDGILFADDWGFQKGILIGAPRWRKYFKQHYQKLYKITHQAGRFTLNHVCGSVYEIIPDLIEIGLDVLESVQPEAKNMNPYLLKREFGNDITFFGGIGSQSTIQFSTPDEIKNEVNQLLEEMPVGGGYILAPAKPIQPGTPIENAAALIESFINQQL